MNLDRYREPARGELTTSFADTDPYYHVEFCFVHVEDGPTLKVDIEPTHLGVFLNEMLSKGNVKILKVELISE